MDNFYEESLAAHRKNRGKLEIHSKFPLRDIRDLSIAYTPGVAGPCEEIRDKPESVWELTMKRNSVAIVTDGSAVLGLGDIGPEAALPVMEGKAILFKTYADVDAWPICLATKDTEEIIRTVRLLAPAFGGVNLEDIAAPRCFEIERSLQDLGIPVFHDDQHGTAIVVRAALINAAKVAGKDFSKLRVVINGAGAAGAAIARILRHPRNLEAKRPNVEDIIVCDSQGILSSKRLPLPSSKGKLLSFTNAHDTHGHLADAMRDADVFIGVSKGNLISADHVATMRDGPIIMALANPIPEIMPEEAYKGGASVVCTGRSDLPNQVNNVLVFPGIFRGALNAKSPRITLSMKMVAAEALANSVSELSSNSVLPSALDLSVAPIIAKAVEEVAAKARKVH